jgi:hypothetical protein
MDKVLSAGIRYIKSPCTWVRCREEKEDYIFGERRNTPDLKFNYLK